MPKMVTPIRIKQKKIAREVKNGLIDIAEDWLNNGGTYDSLDELDNEIKIYFGDISQGAHSTIERNFPRV